MNCCFNDLRNKEIINKTDGSRLGGVCDIEFNSVTGQIEALVIYGRSRLFSSGTEDIRIMWNQIEVIGDDTILVSYTPPQVYNRNRKNSSVQAFFK